MHQQQNILCGRNLVRHLAAMSRERAVGVVLDPAQLIDVCLPQVRLEKVHFQCFAQTAAVVRDVGNLADADVRPAFFVLRGIAGQQQ